MNREERDNIDSVQITPYRHNRIHSSFSTMEILSDCDGTQTLSGAFWVNDAAVHKRDDSNSIDKKARLPDGDVTVSTSRSSTGVNGDSSSSKNFGKVTSTTMLEKNGISSSISVLGTATGMINTTRNTHPTLFTTSTNTLQDSLQDPTNTPPASSAKKRMHMIVGIFVGIVAGILGLFVLAIVYIKIQHREKHEQPPTSPWKIWSDKERLEGPGKFELHGTSMKEKIYELEGRSIKRAARVDVGD
ncbi:fddccd3e-6071-499e-ab79-6eddd826ad0f-CDS [Sclerotinia trifoliorum]|uniref:Fddccd3e-6071-499e-ab79-6eddd826ad0f-CDS n=1 Tax=Sclerotinia trifoliorum TaxID=28548 RepID=A0A8H2VYW0_9HELO|nr:fddccd3e-6071-499e-ab79-6eddd826ad0f-CDS [Sclerotinia trifoliorum]